MQGKVCVVTGANAGIGFETAKALAVKGAEVIMVCRNQEKGEVARQLIREASGHEQVHLMLANMASQQEIRALGTEIGDRFANIDVLVNNAGTWISDLTYTEDGIETVLAVNHLAYFLLTHLLWPSLQNGTSGRIINVASDSHKKADGFNFEDPHLSENYHGLRSYAQSKLANVMFTYEMDRRKPTKKVLVNAVQPGLVYTDIGLKHTTPLHALAWKVRRSLWRGKTPAEGAATSIYLASAQEPFDKSGLYWDACAPKSSSPFSYEEAAAARLWELSKEQCGIEDYFRR